MTTPARLTLGLIAAVAIGGCTNLPDGSRLEDGPAARRAVESAVGVRLSETPPAVLPTGIAGQAFTYSGTSGSTHFTLVVFDNARAVKLLLGSSAARTSIAGMGAVRSRNVVVLYTTPAGAPDPAPALSRALASLN